MSISLKTRILLWGRSGNICAFSDCECQIIQDATPTDEESLVADCCHIYADSDNGPRADASLSQEERDSYENLILLCKVHHKLVDDQRVHYSPSVLMKYKNNHEKKVMEAVSGYKTQQIIREMTVSSVDSLFAYLDIENWKAWTSYIISGGYPNIHKDNYAGLKKAQQFIISRDPNTLTENIRKAFIVTNTIINDFFRYFDEYIEPEFPDIYTNEGTSKPSAEKSAFCFLVTSPHCNL
jgi:hypothetical protein